MKHNSGKTKFREIPPKFRFATKLKKLFRGNPNLGIKKNTEKMGQKDQIKQKKIELKNKSGDVRHC